jgi:hypothetical protein
MDKLERAGALEKPEGVPNFTPEFSGYLVWTIGTAELLDTTVGDWHSILRCFHPSLGSLSPNEIARVVQLFDYYLNHPASPAIKT